MDQQDYFYGEVKHNYWKGNLKLFLLYTGYYLSEALILASINPKYDGKLFLELQKFSTRKLHSTCWYTHQIVLNV